VAAVPMMIAWAMRDIAFPEAMIEARWLKHFPAAEVHLLENASHFLQEDQPEELVRLISAFIART
jgi:pimeloyl-ACP methyl ester carboxylesterase